MKIFKIVIIALAVVLLCVAGWLGYAWYVLTHPEVTDKAQTEVQNDESALATDTGEAVSGNESTLISEPVTVESKSLTKEQRALLESFGIDTTTITITPQMAACAEGALGTDRIEEITKGASPTPLEALKVLPCVR